MKKIISIISLFAIITTVHAQESNQDISASFDKNNDYTYNLGSGILFNFDDSTHMFQIGGMSQPRFLNSRVNDTTLDPGNYFGIKRSYFSLNGSLNKGMFSFLIQTNFSDSYPLLDAWAGYHPNKNLVFILVKECPHSIIYLCK